MSWLDRLRVTLRSITGGQEQTIQAGQIVHLDHRGRPTTFSDMVKPDLAPQPDPSIRGPFDGLKEWAVGTSYLGDRSLDGYRRYGVVVEDDGRTIEQYEREARAWAANRDLEVYPGPDAILVKRRPDGTVRLALDVRPKEAP